MSEDNSYLNALLGLDSHETEPRNQYIKAPFGYVGAKYRSLEHILPRLPYAEVWNEVCGGSGVISINRRPSKLEIFNDRYSGVTDFYRVIRDKDSMNALIRRLRLIVHSREEFIWSRDTWIQCSDPVERAARWYYMIRNSFVSKGQQWARTLKAPVNWVDRIQNSLALFPIFHERFRNFQIENLDALQCLKDYDSHDTVHYVDPDYQATGAGVYKHGVDHHQLMHLIPGLKGFVAVSGYPNPLYDKQSFWDDRIEWKVLVTAKTQGFNDENQLTDYANVMRGRESSTEVLWIKEFS